MLIVGGCGNTADESKAGKETAAENGILEDVLVGEVQPELGVYENKDCAHWVGDTPCNMVLKDQNDEYWELYEHKGKPIVIDFSVMWCGPCKRAADESETIYADYAHYGIEYATVLVEDVSGEEPDLDDILIWVDDHNVQETTVLQGLQDVVDYAGIEGYPLGAWPTFVFINREMEVHWGLHGWNEDTVRSYIEEIL
tara:strand:+ start:1429 stop:2019 length:591 start_codon:yes stop_codon:yes gene_type:complete